MNKRKKGFTVVELVAVLVILAILFTILVPVVSNVLEGQRQKALETQTESVRLAGRDFFTTNRKELPQNNYGDIKEVTLSFLINNGYIEKVEYKGEVCDSENTRVEVMNVGKGDYQYKAYLECGSESIETAGMWTRWYDETQVPLTYVGNDDYAREERMVYNYNVDVPSWSATFIRYKELAFTNPSTGVATPAQPNFVIGTTENNYLNSLTSDSRALSDPLILAEPTEYSKMDQKWKWYRNAFFPNNATEAAASYVSTAPSGYPTKQTSLTQYTAWSAWDATVYTTGTPSYRFAESRILYNYRTKYTCSIQHSSCGFATCANSACGYNSCATSGCGCQTYHSCKNSACGNASCANSACGCQTYKSCRTSACGCQYYTCGIAGNGFCSPITWYYNRSTCSNIGPIICSSSCSQYYSCRTSACGCETYKTCATSGCGYATCRTSGCGCQTYNTCANSACGNKSCATSACGNATCSVVDGCWTSFTGDTTTAPTGTYEHASGYPKTQYRYRDQQWKWTTITYSPNNTTQANGTYTATSPSGYPTKDTSGSIYDTSWSSWSATSPTPDPTYRTIKSRQVISVKHNISTWVQKVLAKAADLQKVSYKPADAAGEALAKTNLVTLFNTKENKSVSSTTEINAISNYQIIGPYLQVRFKTK